MKNIFLKRGGVSTSDHSSVADITNAAEESAGIVHGDDTLSASARDVASVLVRLMNEGKLKFEPNAYGASADFLALLREFDVNAAIRIFEAEKEVILAYDRGRNDAIDDIYKRHELPKSIRSGVGAVAETDYGKMTSQEFNQLKAKLRNS